ECQRPGCVRWNIALAAAAAHGNENRRCEQRERERNQHRVAGCAALHTHARFPCWRCRGRPPAIQAKVYSFRPRRALIADRLEFDDATRRFHMSTLASKQCIPCKGGAAPLKGPELAALLKQLKGWEVINEHHLSKSYSFPNFATALAFVNKVG